MTELLRHWFPTQNDLFWFIWWLMFWFVALGLGPHPLINLQFKKKDGGL